MPLTPSQTRALLTQLDHRAKKSLGQNFLTDGNIVRKSLDLAQLQPDEAVVEIGPGLGTLTEALLTHGCIVYAVERDARLAAWLRESLQPRFATRFHLLEGDAVEHPRAGLEVEANPDFKVVANLPYAITTPWLEGLLHTPLPERMVLMMQREAADRITAQPGSKSFGAISVFVSAAYDRVATHGVSRSCFYPIPGVDSVLLTLRRKPQPFLFSTSCRERIRKLFTQRRKQIGHLLQNDPEVQAWLQQLGTFGCNSTSRPESIPTEAWVAMDTALR